nr:PREDICTED: membrane-spanning 4-domains subfamily A member 4A-like isoform X1 [Latimeria chalumnae]|eukprot:XP_005998397.1 PREDICTED: membrane-spanning 4-domains subfamily A member 4A-like isoform X1 [Latimeria chalumnae]
MVVIRKVISQGDYTKIQAAAASVASSNCSITEQLEKYQKGNPKVLGIIQIMIGIIKSLLGIVLLFFPRLFTVNAGVSLWTGCLFVVSGFLSVASAKITKVSLVKAALGMNIVSAVFARLEIISCSITLATFSGYELNNLRVYGYSYSHFSFNGIEKTLILGILVALVTFSLLELVVTITLSAFGCKGVCYKNIPHQMIYVQNAPNQGHIAVLGPFAFPIQGVPIPALPTYEESVSMLKPSVSP